MSHLRVMVMASLALSCGETRSTSTAGGADTQVSTAQIYAAAALGEPTAAAARRSTLTFREWYDAALAGSSDNPVTIDGMPLRGIHDELMRQAAVYRELDEQFANLGVFFTRAGVPPAASLSQQAFVRAAHATLLAARLAAPAQVAARASGASAPLALLPMPSFNAAAALPRDGVHPLAVRACAPQSQAALLWGLVPVVPTPMRQFLYDLEYLAAMQTLVECTDAEGWSVRDGYGNIVTRHLPSWSTAQTGTSYSVETPDGTIRKISPAGRAAVRVTTQQQGTPPSSVPDYDPPVSGGVTP